MARGSAPAPLPLFEPTGAPDVGGTANSGDAAGRLFYAERDVTLLSGPGESGDSVVERVYRAARVTRIHEGTSAW